MSVTCLAGLVCVWVVSGRLVDAVWSLLVIDFCPCLAILRGPDLLLAYFSVPLQKFSQPPWLFGNSLTAAGFPPGLALRYS